MGVFCKHECDNILKLLSWINQVAAACQSWRERAHLRPLPDGRPGERHPAWLILIASDEHVTSHPLSSWHQVSLTEFDLAQYCGAQAEAGTDPQCF